MKTCIQSTMQSEPTDAEQILIAQRDIIEQLSLIRLDIVSAVGKIETANDVLSFLMSKKVKAYLKNAKIGKINRTGRDYDAVKRADEDMAIALERVNSHVQQGKKVLDACRYVVDHFKKLGSGKYGSITYLPLRKWNGDEIQSETLAKNYRAKFGTRKERLLRRR